MNRLTYKAGIGSFSNETIVLGRVGEHLAQAIVFDCSAFAQLYGMGTAVLYARLPSGEKYPVPVAQDGSTVTWTVRSADLGSAGLGRGELQWIVNDAVAKTHVFRTRIRESLTGTDVEAPPDPYTDWVDQITAVGTQAVQDAQSAAESAQAAAASERNAAESEQSASQSAERALADKNAAAGSASAAAAAKTAAEAVRDTVTQKAAEAAQSAAGAAASRTAAESAKTDAQTAKADAEAARQDIQDSVDDVAQELTAQQILAQLRQILPVLTEIAGPGGFRLELDGTDNGVFLTYTDPDTGTELAREKLATDSTGQDEALELHLINIALREYFMGGQA